MANTLTGGYGLRPISKVGSNVNSTGITSMRLKVTTQLLFSTAVLLFR